MIKNMVETILKDYPEARSDDKVLLVYFFKQFYSCLKIDDILLVPVSIETIKRERRRFQNKGFYLSQKQIDSGRIPIIKRKTLKKPLEII